jgi:hypothetical protein
MAILDFLKRPAPSSAEIRVQIEKLESELPQLNEAVIASFDISEGPEFRGAVEDRTAARERLKILSELLPELETREREAAAAAAVAAAAEMRRIEQKRFDKLSVEFLRTADLLRRNIKGVLENVRDLDRMAAELPLAWILNGNGCTPRQYVERTLAAPVYEPLQLDFVAMAEARLETARKNRFDPDPIYERPEPEQYPEVVTMSPAEAMSVAAGWGHHGPIHRELLAPTMRYYRPPPEDLDRQERLASTWRPAALPEAARPSRTPVREPAASTRHEAVQSETPHQAAGAGDQSTRVEPSLPAEGTDGESYKEELGRHLGELKRHGIEVDEDA